MTRKCCSPRLRSKRTKWWAGQKCLCASLRAPILVGKEWKLQGGQCLIWKLELVFISEKPWFGCVNLFHTRHRAPLRTEEPWSSNTPPGPVAQWSVKPKSVRCSYFYPDHCLQKEHKERAEKSTVYNIPLSAEIAEYSWYNDHWCHYHAMKKSRIIW